MRSNKRAAYKLNTRNISGVLFYVAVLLVSFFIIGKSLVICMDMTDKHTVTDAVMESVNEAVTTLFGQMFPNLTYEEEYGASSDYVYESGIPEYFYEDEDTKSKETIYALESDENVAETAQSSITQNGVDTPTIVSENGTGVTYTNKQLYDYDFLINNFYVVDSSTTLLKSELKGKKLLNTDVTIDLTDSDYKILIYHTHGSEAFADSREGVVEDTVIGVGDVLTEILESKYNIHVYHDRTVYDMVDGKLDRSYAYTLSKKGVTQILADHPSIEVIIDLHRDGVEETTHLVTTIGGKPTAKIMFLNGVSRSKKNGDISYLYNPYKETNLAFSLQMYVVGKGLYGDLMRKIYIRSYCYNLNLMPRATLIEVGAQTNTVEEEKNAMEPLADILYQVLKGE